MDHTPQRFTVASHLSTAVWTVTDGISGVETTRRQYAEINGVPLESVSVGTRVQA